MIVPLVVMKTALWLGLTSVAVMFGPLMTLGPPVRRQGRTMAPAGLEPATSSL